MPSKFVCCADGYGRPKPIACSSMRLSYAAQSRVLKYVPKAASKLIAIEVAVLSHATQLGVIGMLNSQSETVL